MLRLTNALIKKGGSDDSYGVALNPVTGDAVRLGTISDYLASETVPDLLLPIHTKMKRCVVEDDSTIAYYLGQNDSTKKANGDAAVLDGTDGQVMVEMTKGHYWKVEFSDGYIIIQLSPTYKAGWNYFAPNQFMGAYEAQVYDHGVGIIGGRTGITVAAEDKLCSVSGTKAKTNETRAEYRTLAAAGHILEGVEVPKKTIMYGFFQDIELESGKVEAVSLARTLE